MLGDDLLYTHGSAVTPRTLDNAFVNAWVRRDGRWQMVHWASTPIPK